MGAILLIVAVSFVIFIGLTLLMKKTDPPSTDEVVEDPLLSCGVCHDEFPESEMISRKVGDAGYTRWFCDGCIVDLYQESREMHDPRSKES